MDSWSSKDSLQRVTGSAKLPSAQKVGYQIWPVSASNSERWLTQSTISLQMPQNDNDSMVILVSCEYLAIMSPSAMFTILFCEQNAWQKQASWPNEIQCELKFHSPRVGRLCKLVQEIQERISGPCALIWLRFQYQDHFHGQSRFLDIANNCSTLHCCTCWPCL